MPGVPRKQRQSLIPAPCPCFHPPCSKSKIKTSAAQKSKTCELLTSTSCLGGGKKRVGFEKFAFQPPATCSHFHATPTHQSLGLLVWGPEFTGHQGTLLGSQLEPNAPWTAASTPSPPQGRGGIMTRGRCPCAASRTIRRGGVHLTGAYRLRAEGRWRWEATAHTKSNWSGVEGSY